MNARVALAFVVALALMGGLVFNLDRLNLGPPTATPTPINTEEFSLFQFDDRKATALALKAGEKSVNFQKEGETWKIVGSQDPANQVSISSLLIRMSQLKGQRKIEPGADLKQFGLDAAKLEATVTLDDGTTHRVLLGDKTPVGTGYYARADGGSTVTVVSTQFGTDIERLANDPKEPPTPTPRPSPTATPTPSITPTPAAAATPTP